MYRKLPIATDGALVHGLALAKSAGASLVTLATVTEMWSARHHGARQIRHVKGSHPSDGILKAAEETGCDLIVMSSHGRRGIYRLLLGSVAAEVVTLSKVPVMTVR